MEKFENKLIDMRLLYEDKMSGSTTTIDDPFFESQQNHSLIGVANVFLDVLFYDVHLDYQVPIISQQGEVGIDTFDCNLQTFINTIQLM
jgi:kinesin family protein 13